MNYYKRKLPTRAGGIIFDKNTKFILLVLNRDSYFKKENKWGLPKGHLNNYERNFPHIGAQREILEETGIYFPLNENSFAISIYDTMYYVSSLCKKSNPVFFPKDQTEIIYACWFPVNAINKLNVNRTLSKLILKWRNIFPDINSDFNSHKNWYFESKVLKTINSNHKKMKKKKNKNVVKLDIAEKIKMNKIEEIERNDEYENEESGGQNGLEECKLHEEPAEL
tara:strand:- start:609 stop:1280 length:672 start_codon:yes stop_codon:yes gene_type:complete